MTETAATKADHDAAPSPLSGHEAAFASLSRDDWPSTLARLNERAPALREAYESAEPFPHVVIDGLFDDDLLDGIAAEFPDPGDEGWRASTSPDGGRNPWAPVSDLAGPLTHILVQRMNAKSFIDCLAAITGIEDPIGSSLPSLQQTQPGNRLGVHIDGVKTDQTGLYLRLTTMLFLNRGWSESYAGDFELWNEDASACVKPIAPLFNRLVIFVNSDRSYHGFPRAMRGPAAARRRSLLLRYLTARMPEGTGRAPGQRIYGSQDRSPEPPLRPSRIKNALRQVTPPILIDLIRKMR